MKLLALIGLLCLASATQTQTEFFESLSKDEFGRTVIQTIQLELGQDQNNFDKVVNFLNDMMRDLKQEQQDQTELAKKREQGCAARFQDIDQVVGRAAEKRADDERQLPLREEELQDKEEQATEKNGEEQRNLDRITLITQEREVTRKEYEARRDELVGQIAALQEAKTIVRQLKRGSFLQESMGTIFTEIKDHHANFMKQFPRQRGFHQLVSLLLETTQDPGLRADQGMVETIVEIIDGLVESLYDVQKTELQTDDQRQSDFITQKTRLLSQNEHLAHSIASLQAQVHTLNQRLVELKNDIASQTRLIEVKQKERKDWDITCTQESAGFKRAQTGRNEQMEILSQVLAVFQGGFSAEARKFIAQLQISA